MSRTNDARGRQSQAQEEDIVRRAFRLGVLVAVAALVATATATAADVIVNPYFGCGGGTRTVPAGSTIVIRQGWVAANRGLAQDFEGAVTTVLTIDGANRADADDPGYGSLIGNPDGWTWRWSYPTGITLGAGDSMSFTFDWIVSHPIHDGIVLGGDHDMRPALGGPGSVFGGPLACTVTGV
jgi:hypothetical protein